MIVQNFKCRGWDTGTAPIVSLVMLFGDLQRWTAFSRRRYDEALRSQIIGEVVFVINREDESTVLKVKRAARKLHGLPIQVLFNDENNIPAGRNAGVAVARGSVIVIWDDDDEMDPVALRRAYNDVFVPCGFSILELPLAHGDGSSFHPQSSEIMPQVPFPGRDDILVVGMVHTPFITTRDLLTRVPIPECVPLRGDWLHWSVRLWRQGVPLLCLKGTAAREATRSRKKGATASSIANDFSTFHAFVSLLILFCHYNLLAESAECQIVRRRYFDKYCSEHHDDVWRTLMRLGQSLRDGLVEDLSNMSNVGSWRILREAYLHVNQLVTKRNGKVRHLGDSPIHDVGPFEMLSPGRKTDLSSILGVPLD